MLTKYATFDQAEVLDLKGAPSQQHFASLEILADFENYRTGDGYLYVRIRAISSRVNKNSDGWPSVELAGGPEIFDRHHSAGGFTVEASEGNPEFGFSTFVGKPIFVDHHNSNPKKARGVIVDAKLNVLDQKTASGDDYWTSSDVDREHLPPTEVELLLEVDAKSFPTLAKSIQAGDLDGFSMGCDVQESKCSHCGHVATSPEEFCSHIVMKGAHHDYKTADGKKISRKSYENCVTPETSILLADGRMIAIQDVESGMIVLDHLGEPRSVLQVTSRDIAQDILEISRSGQGFDRPLRVTANHPLLAVRGEGLTKAQVKQQKPEFINAGALREDDWIVEVSPTHRESLKNVLTPRVTRYLHRDIPETIELNKDFGRWCGWYLAEGSISYNRLSSGERSESSVCFSLHANEVDERDEIIHLGRTLFGLEGKTEIRHNGATVLFHNRPLALFMSQLGTSSHTKALPHDWLSGSITFIDGVVSAHQAGDGHHNPDGERWNEVLHVTSSSTMADQLYDMNIWLGNTPSRRWDKPTPQNKRTVPATHLAYPAIRQRSARNRIQGEWTLSKVSRIDRVAYDGPVYNLEIDKTHTYVANGQAVHNCYGIKFFEISAVFDPADETALAREVRSAVYKESGLDARDPLMPYHTEVADLAMQYQMKGVDHATAMDMARRKIMEQQGVGHGEGWSAEGQPNQWRYDTAPGPMPQMPEGYDPTLSHTSHTHTAENPLPQEMMTRAPEELDTLRDERLCPICGADMKDETCSVCGFVQPPKEYDNPDLSQAQKIRDQMKQKEEEVGDQPNGVPEQGEQLGDVNKPGKPLTSELPRKAPQTANVVSDMRWTPKVHPKTAARINKVERPITPSNPPQTDEPRTETVIKDQTRPVTSAMATAQQLMANAQRNHGEHMNTRTADGPTPPGDTAPMQRVDVTGVGGVDHATNEEASKTNVPMGQTEQGGFATVDVTGIGGTGITDVDQGTQESLPTASRDGDDSGFNTDKTTEDSGPTKTYGDKDGEHPGVTEPVTRETLEREEQQGGSKGPVSHTRQAYDDSILEKEQEGDDPIAQGGSAVQGVQPIDSVATPSYKRVNVLEHETSPENNSGPTTTWTGTDGNGVLKQQDPTTNEKMEWGGVPTPDVQLHTTGRVSIAALRLAETEVELGLIDPGQKWNRLAEADAMPAHEVHAQLLAYSKVKTAGLNKLASHRQSGVTKLPRNFQRIATGSEETEQAPISDESLDAGLFLR